MPTMMHTLSLSKKTMTTKVSKFMIGL